MKAFINTLLLTVCFSFTAFCQMPDYHVGGIALDELESTYIIVQFKKSGRVTNSDSSLTRQYYKALITHGSNQPCLLREEAAADTISIPNLCDCLRDKHNQLVRVPEPIEILNVIEKMGWEMVTPIKRKKRVKKTHHLVFMFQKTDS